MSTAPADAWARLLGLDGLRTLQVVVADTSPLTRPRWIGLLGLDETITAIVPDEAFVEPVTKALVGLAPNEAVDADVVRERLPPTTDVLGPAQLLYLTDAEVHPPMDGERVDHAELAALFADVTDDELDESGLRVGAPDVPIFASRTPDGTIAAVCGYHVWPNGVAHLGVLAATTHRRQGLAAAAARAAIADAAAQGLLPQWRARVAPSIALARRLGFTHHGAQLSFQPAGRPGGERAH